MLKLVAGILMTLALADQGLLGCDCGITDAPAEHLGYADPKGQLEFWRKITDLSLSDEMKIPLRIQYDSGRQQVSDTVGAGRWIPLLESYMVDRDWYVDYTTIGGSAKFLIRSKDGKTYESPDKKWTGSFSEGDVFTINALFPDEFSEFKYVKGKLREARLSNGHVLSWIYNGKSISAIREEGSGVLLSVDRSSDDGLAQGLVVNGKRYEFEATTIPLTAQLGGKTLVNGFAPALGSITWPDKSSERYAYALDQEGKIHLSMEQRSSGELKIPSQEFVYNAETRQLLSDGTYTYDLIKKSEDNFVVSRKNAAGQTEWFYYDKNTGIGTHRTFDGREVARHFMLTRGPNNLKLRKKVVTENGKATVVLQNAFDESGRLIRQVKDGLTTTLAYGETGKLISKVQTKGEGIMLSEKYDKLGRLVEKTQGVNTYGYRYERGVRVVQRNVRGKLFATLLDYGDTRKNILVSAAQGSGGEPQVQGFLSSVPVRADQQQEALAVLKRLGLD